MKIEYKRLAYIFDGFLATFMGLTLSLAQDINVIDALNISELLLMIYVLSRILGKRVPVKWTRSIAQ